MRYIFYRAGLVDYTRSCEGFNTRRRDYCELGLEIMDLVDSPRKEAKPPAERVRDGDFSIRQRLKASLERLDDDQAGRDKRLAEHHSRVDALACQ